MPTPRYDPVAYIKMDAGRSSGDDGSVEARRYRDHSQLGMNRRDAHNPRGAGGGVSSGGGRDGGYAHHPFTEPPVGDDGLLAPRTVNQVDWSEDAMPPAPAPLPAKQTTGANRPLQMPLQITTPTRGV